MYVNIHTYTYICVCVHRHTDIYVYMCVCIYRYVHICSMQLTLEKHAFKPCTSGYMQIFFNKYSTCIFISQIFKLTKCGEKFVFN